MPITRSSLNPHYDHHFLKALHLAHADPWNVRMSAYAKAKAKMTYAQVQP